MVKHGRTTMKWTDEKVEAFCQVYSGNFESKTLMMIKEKFGITFNWTEFHGLKMKQKLKLFKQKFDGKSVGF
jgi:hypothetical protein